MNRYDQIFGFDGFSAFIRNIPRQKVDYASMALIRHREDGYGQDDDEEIARQFGLKGMDEFWEIEFSEPMTCNAFGHALAVHLAAPREPTQGYEAHIRQALRAARSYGQPWFMEIPNPPPSNKLSHPYRRAHLPGETKAAIAHVTPPDPPVDGIDLSKLRVRPREAALWMLGNPMRQHLVPASLAAVLRPKAENATASDKSSTCQLQVTDQPEPVSATMPRVIFPREAPGQGKPAKAKPARKRGPRPKVGPRVQAEMRSAIQNGEDLGAMSQYQMHVRFQASESLCRDIRAAILSEDAGDANSA